MRIAAALRIIRGHHRAPMRMLLRTLLIPSTVLSRRIRTLEVDACRHLTLCHVPHYQHPLWLPGSPGDGVETTVYLHTLDCYHFAYVGHLIRRGAVVVDCGGYAGEFALWALERDAEHVFVFEPHPRNAECIRRNLSRFISAGRVSLRAEAVWSHDTTLSLAADGSSNVHHVCAEQTPHQGPGDDATHVIPVPATSIDSLLSEAQPRGLDFIKMDIEGAERHAVRGAATTLSTCEPALAICTYHLPDDRLVIPSLVRQANPSYAQRANHCCFPLYVARGGATRP